MIGLKASLIIASIVTVVVLVIAALPLASYGDWKSKDLEVIGHFEAFVAQEEGSKGVFSVSFQYRDYSAESYSQYWWIYWSGIFDFGTIDVSFPTVSLVINEKVMRADGTYYFQDIPGVEKFQYFDYVVGQQWSMDILIPAESGMIIRYQMQIYLALSQPVGIESGTWTVP